MLEYMLCHAALSKEMLLEHEHAANAKETEL